MQAGMQIYKPRIQANSWKKAYLWILNNYIFIGWLFTNNIYGFAAVYSSIQFNCILFNFQTNSTMLLKWMGSRQPSSSDLLVAQSIWYIYSVVGYWYFSYFVVCKFVVEIKSLTEKKSPKFPNSHSITSNFKLCQGYAFDLSLSFESMIITMNCTLSRINCS
jgi:hypothetical protein